MSEASRTKTKVWQGGTERVEEYAMGMGKVHRIYGSLAPKRQVFENRNNARRIRARGDNASKVESRWGLCKGYLRD